MYKDKKVIHLVARGLNGEIGADNKLLWHIKSDLKHFKESTLGHVLLMGRATYDNLPKKLDRRIILRVTQFPFKDANCGFGGNFERDIDSYIDEASYISENHLNTNSIFIAGGQQLYTSTFDITDELWVTEVDKEFPNADRHYYIPEGFKLINTRYDEDIDLISGEQVALTFNKYARV